MPRHRWGTAQQFGVYIAPMAVKLLGRQRGIAFNKTNQFYHLATPAQYVRPIAYLTPCAGVYLQRVLLIEPAYQSNLTPRR
jgi:hypothetical protein